MSTLSKLMRRTVYVFADTTINDWSDVTEIVIEVRPDDRIKALIHEALDKRKVPVRGGNDEIQFYIDSFLTGANL